MIPFVLWLLMHPVVRFMGYFTPQRIGLADEGQTKAAEDATNAKKTRKRKATAP